ncbi:MAG: substrate-binding domain-containing protein [Verrucomicrobia bacterium]|nr:substrate-binding domain-containing protein [Verrucomicrobiota bacterium]
MQISRSNFNGLGKVSSIFIYASDASMHVQRLVQGAAAYARVQTPRLRVVWGSQMVDREGLAQNDIQGIIFFALRAGEHDLLQAYGLPAVNVSTRNLPTTFASVIPDDHAIGHMAAQHFKSNQYRNFAFVGVKSHRYSLLRGNAFAESVFPAECQILWLSETNDMVRSNQEISDFLTSLPTPVGILAANDRFARRICECAVELGIQVPEQIAVLGVDAEQMVSLASPVQLSSVDIDSFKIGYKAMEILHDLIKDPAIPPRQMVLLQGEFWWQPPPIIWQPKTC